MAGADWSWAQAAVKGINDPINLLKDYNEQSKSLDDAAAVRATTEQTKQTTAKDAYSFKKVMKLDSLISKATRPDNTIDYDLLAAEGAKAGVGAEARDFVQTMQAKELDHQIGVAYRRARMDKLGGMFMQGGVDVPPAERPVNQETGYPDSPKSVAVDHGAPDQGTVMDLGTGLVKGKDTYFNSMMPKPDAKTAGAPAPAPAPQMPFEPEQLPYVDAFLNTASIPKLGADGKQLSARDRMGMLIKIRQDALTASRPNMANYSNDDAGWQKYGADEKAWTEKMADVMPSVAKEMQAYRTTDQSVKGQEQANRIAKTNFDNDQASIWAPGAYRAFASKEDRTKHDALAENAKTTKQLLRDIESGTKDLSQPEVQTQFANELIKLYNSTASGDNRKDMEKLIKEMGVTQAIIDGGGVVDVVKSWFRSRAGLAGIKQAKSLLKTGLIQAGADSKNIFTDPKTKIVSPEWRKAFDSDYIDTPAAPKKGDWAKEPPPKTKTTPKTSGGRREGESMTDYLRRKRGNK